jgi:hypothetical protein
MNEPPLLTPPVLPQQGIVTWHGSTVSVRSHVVPRYFWTTVSINAYLDDQCILQTGGKLNPTGSSSSTFNHGGTTHTAELSWGVGIMYAFPYQLKIDGVPIMASRVRADNWYITLIIGMFFGTVIGVLAFLFLHKNLSGMLH